MKLDRNGLKNTQKSMRTNVDLEKGTASFSRTKTKSGILKISRNFLLLLGACGMVSGMMQKDLSSAITYLTICLSPISVAMQLQLLISLEKWEEELRGLSKTLTKKREY